MKEKTFDTLFGGKGESMEKKTSRIKERFLPVSKSLPSLMVAYELAQRKGDPFITFASRGGGGFQKLPKIANGSTDRLREMRIKGGRGSKIPKFLRT